MADGVTTRGAGDELLVEARGPIRIVTLNRPGALNAADEALHGEIARVWRELAADGDARAIVLTGAGKAFSAGGDIGLLDRMIHDTALRDRIMAEGVEIVRAMTAVRVPVVAAVNGPAVGLGCSLASMSDLVVMEEQAYFADPHVSLGLVAADGGALTWPLLTSLLRAKEFIILGDRLKAPEAVQIGLANRVVEKGTSLEVALELADRIAALPPQAVVETKAVLNDTLRRAVGTVLEGAIAAETASFDEPAFQANVAAFLKRSS
jgi:enoyl-CoA hydratase